MTQLKLDECKEFWKELRGKLRNIRFDEMVRLIKMLGRTQRAGSSPPTYVSPLSTQRAIQIHYHPQLKQMPEHDARRALKHLAADIDAWQLRLNEENAGGNGHA